MDRQPSVATPPASFLDLLAESHDYVLSLRLIDGPIAIARRYFNIAISTRLMLLLWAMLAPALALAILPFDDRAWNITLISVSAYSILIYLLLYYPRTSWRGLEDVAVHIENLMPDAKGRTELTDWLQRRLALGLQTLLAGMGAAIAVLVAVLFVKARKFDALVCAPYFLTAALIGALGVNAAWWMWQAPSLGRLILRASIIHLDWPAPAETPGIATSRELILKSIRRNLIGALVTFTPIIITALAEPTSTTVLSIIFGVGFITFATGLISLLVPGYWLTLIVTRFETALFAKLRADLLDANPLLPDATAYERLAIFRLLTDHRTRSWDVKFILSLAFASLSAFVALAAFVVTITQG